MKSWLTNGYSDRHKVEQDRDSGVLPQDVVPILMGIHIRSEVPLAEMPSALEIQFLEDLYDHQKGYIARLFYQKQTTSTYEIDVVVIRNIKAHFTVSDVYYDK